MAKGRKRTRGLRINVPMPFKEPTPAERVDRAAKHLVLESLESHPGMMTLARKIGKATRESTGKLIREVAKGHGKDSVE